MNSTVPPGRGASLHHYPGTSCLATIVLSLRDKSHSPIEAPRIKLMLMGARPAIGGAARGRAGGRDKAG